ncbi:MAG: hypothetical protein A3F90_07150 [Deltaproteobacteria bacterium RIFCSPLOWO2_12_FULL_60_19]|nr:MAG: hypothetical protein A3F90_07150 [Deltaproteobacteria bacterium RIFCSPLOWO2_12_FULL_60_19]
MGQEEYSELSSFLQRFIRRFRAAKELEGFCLIGMSLALLFSLGLAVREIKPSLPYAPALYSVTAALVLILLLGWMAFQLRRRLSREWAARSIELQCPQLRNNLINSLQLYPQIAAPKPEAGISVTMVLALLRATRKQVHSLRVEELVSAQPVRTKARLLGLLMAPVLAAILLDPSSLSDTFSLLAYPLKDLPPSETRFDVTPKGSRVAYASGVTVQATASGAIPKFVELAVQPAEGGPEERLVMESLGQGKFTITLPNVKNSFHYRAVAGVFSSPRYLLEAVEPPEIVNVKITVYPPHYTGLPAQTLQGGNAEGLKGSTIRLEASSTKEITKAKLVLQNGRELPLKIDAAGKKLQGNLVLFESQRYELQVEDALGFRNKPISYELRARPDGFPTVELLRPTEDLEINGDETLPVEFSARDDFGVQEAALTIKIGDKQEKIPIRLDGVKKLVLRERFSWDLGKLGLREGEEAVYQVEVLDNDTISGPKLGLSRPLRLRLKNLKGEHKQVAEMIRELSGRMVDLLSDHLEKPAATAKDPTKQDSAQDKAFEQKLDETLKSVENLMQRTEKDRLADFATWSDLDALKRNLKFTKDELLKKQEQAASAQDREQARDEISTELERMSLLSEEIGKRLKAEELAAAARDLMKSQERLMDSLEALKSGDKNLDAVLKQISELAKLLSSMQQALSQFASRLPDDFVNNEALRGLNFNEMFSALDEIRKKLMQGDFEGAMQLARELFNQMASMVASLQNAQQSAMSSSMGRMQGEMMRSANELQQIAREQQEILVDTEDVNKQRQGEREQALKEKLDRYLAQAHAELAKLAELFPDEERESGGGRGPREDVLDEATVNNLVKEMISRLLKKNFPGFEEILGMAQKELEKKRAPEQEQKSQRGQASLKGLKDDLDALFGIPQTALRDEDKQNLRELSRRQENLKERTEELSEKLDSLFQLFPALDPQITRNIREAGASMGQAQGRLGDLDARGAVPPERQALDRLSQSQQQMQSSMQQMAQRGQLGRMPVSRLFRMGRFLPSGELIPLPGMPQFPQFDVEGGVTGLDTERFRLPGKEDYRAPRSFREEILESLKQGVPRRLKEQIESYFKNLTE